MHEGGRMFITIKLGDRNRGDDEAIINISQIVSIENNIIHMSNGLKYDPMANSMREIRENLFGSEKVASVTATEYTKTLLNDLNRLLGGTRDAKPTTDRKARLKTRLKDFSEEELKIAAKNLGEDEFMQGANDNNKRYGTIDYLIRTSANINKWLEDQPEKKKKGMF